MRIKPHTFTFIYTFLCFWVLEQPLQAQQTPTFSTSKNLTQFLIGNWTTEAGLPSNILNSVIQSQEGYVWIATYDGLVRFDGMQFTVFDRKNTKNFATNSFTCFYENPNENTLWIGSEGNGLLSYKHGQFKSYKFKNGEAPRVDYIYQTKNKKILVGFRSAGIAELVGNNLTPLPNYPFPKDHVKAIIEDQAGNLWIGTDGKGIVRKVGDTFEVIDIQKGLPDNKITAFYQDNQQKIWIGTSNGLCVFNPQTQVFDVLPALQGYAINRILQDGSQDFWLATAKGLIRYKPSMHKLEILDESNGLSNKWIRDMAFDREGSLWLAMYRGGLCRMKDGKFTNYTTLEGLGSNIINYVYEITPNEYLIGCDAKHIYRLKDNKISTFPISTDIGNQRVRYFLKDSKGILWVSTEVGLLRILPNGKEELWNEKTGLPDNMVNQIFEDKQGSIWLATRAAGLIKVIGDKQFQVYNKKSGFANFITCIKEDSKGDLLVATNDAGLFVMQKDGQFVRYSVENALPSNLIFSVYPESADKFWLATNAGLSLLNPQTKKVYQFGELSYFALYDILKDKKGNFWLPSSKGIAKVAYQDLIQFTKDTTQQFFYEIYGKHDGMKNEQCVGATLTTIAQDGKLWFPTLGGVAVINPDSIAVNPLRPNVFIESFMVDNEMVDIRQAITLGAGKKRFVFHYTALSLLASPKVKFKYQLEKLDKDWIEAGTERNAVYTNLSAGKYRFRVIACNNDGLWNEVGATLEFELQPFFYQTWWFYLLCAIVFGGVGYAIYQGRLAIIKRRNEELEKLVQIRTAEINQQKEEIASQRDNIQLQQEKLVTAYQDIQEANSQITEQKDVLQLQFSQIQKSVQAAKIIQEAILPIDEQVKRYLPNYFVMFRPKDVVSGDFYWIEKENNHIFVAAVDCTGHGVPGAFMSMIGNMLLDNIVKIQKIYSPEKILTELNVEVYHALKQQEGKDNNGMDVALVVWEQGSYNIEFTGAKRSLYYTQPTDNQITTLKGDRKSIGGKHNKGFSFTKHSLDLQASTLLYLCSDGYSDQCNAQRENLGELRMVAVLNQIAQLPITEQKSALIHQFDTYRQGTEQRDDVLVMGWQLA